MRVFTIVCLTLLTAACGGRIQPALPAAEGVDTAQLWVDPVDLEQRDLLHGPGGREQMPDTAMPFEFVAEDRTGYSRGYDVRDARGRTWSVKLGPEAQPEVAVSRLLWAIGFHQPPVYYVPAWTMSGQIAGPQPAARFRPELPDWKVVDEWSWYENAFVETRQFKGLVVANLLVNNWDWKTSNNRVYEIPRPDGAGTQRIYVVRDLGASLGKTSFPQWLNWFPMRGLGQGSRNEVADFESQGFIQEVDGDRVSFVYRGIHANVLEIVTPEDVVWTCRLMARLSDAQLQDAFKAAGYTDDHVQRYVAHLKKKIAEGLALAAS